MKPNAPPALREPRGLTFVTVAWLATGLAVSGCHPGASTPGHAPPGASTDGGTGGAQGASSGGHAPAAGEGSIEGTITLTGPLPPPVAVDIDAPTAARPGCSDAARFYSLPFGISQPGPLEAALVTADAHLVSPVAPRRQVMNFRDCSIHPRLMVLSLGDTVVLHADTTQYHFPKVEGLGATIAQMLQPTQDQEKTPVHPGRYIVHSVNYPNWMQTPMIVLPNPFYGQSDAQGHYRVAHVPPGTVTVHAWYPGARAVDIPVTVVAGQVVRQDFSLTPAAPPPDAGVPHPVDAGAPIP